MITTERTIVKVEAHINAPVEKVWELWTDPKHIIHWNNASDDWHTPYAENELRAGGRFLSRMEAKDGSTGFNFSGVYDNIEKFRQIEYTIDDGRKVKITFHEKGDETEISEFFESEDVHSIELQKEGWQSIMNNFKKYVETSGNMQFLHFEIQINASVEKVYKTMIDEKGFAEWTSEFNSSSSFQGSWQKGSKILFLGIEKDGSTSGTVSKIRENIPDRFISIEHLGVVMNGNEITSGPEADEWTGAMENYTFVENEGKTLLSIDLNVAEKYKSIMEDLWPKALLKLKEICEKQ